MGREDSFYDYDKRQVEREAAGEAKPKPGRWTDAFTRDIFTGLTPEEAEQEKRYQEQRRTAEIAARPRIVPCPACGKQISPEADACIHCGQPMNTAIKCPTCKSRDVVKISAASKVGSAVLFGVFAMGKLTKTYQCRTCGFRW